MAGCIRKYEGSLLIANVAVSTYEPELYQLVATNAYTTRQSSTVIPST